jgi:hypothetical protein
MIDATVINKQACECSSAVLDSGYSNNLAQIININVNRPKNKEPLKSTEIQFTKESIDEVNHLLQKDSWQECFLNLDVNTSFNVFVDLILYQYNIAFPLETV